MPRPYSAADVKHLTGVTLAQIRDWRRRGLLDGVGARDGGRWSYDDREVELFRRLGAHQTIAQIIATWRGAP